MKVIFPADQYKRLRAYINNIQYEISGLGKVRLVGEDIFIEEIRIFEQTVTPAETKLPRQALMKFYDQIMQEEGDLSAWKLWWHSHCDFEAFFSATDVQTITDFDNETPLDNWMLSIVANQAGDMQIRLDVYQPIRCRVPNLQYDITFDDPRLDDEVWEEITEKVTIQRPAYTPPAQKRTFGWNPTPPAVIPHIAGASISTNPTQTTIIEADPASMSAIIEEEGKKIYKKH